MIEDKCRDVHRHLGTVLQELLWRKGIRHLAVAFDEITLEQLVSVHTTNDVALPCRQVIANICYLAM